MFIKTHLVISLFLGLIFLDFSSNKILFLVFVLVATYIPDIDCKDSSLGKFFLFRPLQFLFGHRKFFHSFSFLIFLCLIFILFFQHILTDIFFGFILGYSSHLIADSLTKEGIYLFYPIDFKIFGFIKTGDVIERFVFSVFLVVDLFLIFKIIFSIF